MLMVFVMKVFKIGSIFSLGLSLTFATFPQAGWAETVMEKVARTGILTVGTRLDAVPYAYVDDQGNLVGYSIDVLNLIKDELSAQLGKEITIQVVPETQFADRIPQLVKGVVDISCDTAFTWQRDRYVDFSVSYGISGIRLVVPKNSLLGSATSLTGKRIGVPTYTIAEQAIQVVQPKAITVSIPNLKSGFAELQQGKLDAIAGDTVLLAGEIARTKSNTLVLAPAKPYARYGIACMVPEDNSSFLDLVNYAIVKMMQNYVTGKSTATVDRWFGANGVVDLPPDLIRGFFESIIVTRSQVPPTNTVTSK